MIKNKIKIFKILLSITIITIIAVIVWYLFPIITKLSTNEGRMAFQEKIKNWKVMGLLVLLGLQVSQIFLFFIPGEPIEILAGMCYGGIGGTAFIICSASFISIGIFFIVRKFGKKFVYSFCNKEKVQKIEKSQVFQNPKKIEKIMLILFLLPGTPKDLLVYISGLLPIKPSKFIIISTFARIPSIISSTLAGANIIAGNWKNGIIIYLIIVIPIITAIFLINKLDRDKSANEAIKVINR